MCRQRCASSSTSEPPPPTHPPTHQHQAFCAQTRVAPSHRTTFFAPQPWRVAALLMAERVEGCRHIQFPPAKGATSALVVATRAAERRSCPSARHHSAGPGVVTQREQQQEEVDHETCDGLRALNTPPPGEWPASLPEVAGPQAAVTVGYVAARTPSLAVVPVSDDRIDDAALQFLLQQSLLARRRRRRRGRRQW